MRKLEKTIAALLMSISMIGFYAPQQARAALAEVGPVNQTTGFPVWYRDANGLTLDLMEAADPFSISAPVEAGNPFSGQIGFGPEGFWWSADAAFDNGAQTGLLVLATEAAFAGESAIDGEQSAFGRIRYRIDGLVPGETYTVRHPYGNATEIANVAGVINVTTDIGCFATAGITTCDPAKVGTGTPPLVSAGGFGVALSSGVGPFLTWSTFGQTPIDPLLVNPLHPDRTYIGNPGIDHAITGSPIGQNLFAVEGPGLAAGTQTNLFTVTGRLAILAPTVTVDTQTATVDTPTITGTISDPNATVSVVVNAQPAINATVNPNGTWSATVATPLANGTYEVVATGTNAGGSGADTSTNELTVNVPVGGLAVSVTALSTTDTTPIITGTISDPLATLSVLVEGEALVGTNNGDGTWSATVITALAVGQHEVAVTATAADGITTATDATLNELTVTAVVPPVEPPAPGGGGGGGGAPADQVSTIVVETSAPQITELDPAKFIFAGSKKKKAATIVWKSATPSVGRIFFTTGKKSLLSNVNFGDVLDGKRGMPKKVKLANEISPIMSQIGEGDLRTDHSMSIGGLKKGAIVHLVVVSQRPDGTERVVSDIISVRAR